jgi:hypothetical protein
MLENQNSQNDNSSSLELFQSSPNIQKKNNRYFIDDFWWHRPDPIHKALSRLPFPLPPITTSERASVLLSKAVTQNKDTNKFADGFFKTSDFIIQNLLKQPRDCIIYYSNSIGMAKFQQQIEDTNDLCFIHFTPNDQISKPKRKIDQIKAVQSCGMSFLKLIDSGCQMPKYLIGVSNTEMTEFATRYGFTILPDPTRVRIEAKSTNSKAKPIQLFYKKWLKLYDDTINTVVYLESSNLHDPAFRQKIVEMVQKTNLLIERMER